jgi:hypothetical protein
MSSFQEKADAGASFFESLFQASTDCPIWETLEVVAKLPSFIMKKMNQALNAEVTEPKVNATLSSM